MRYKRTCITLLSMVGIGLCALPGPRPSIAQGTGGTIAVQVALARPVLSVGEPVVLNYAITNQAQDITSVALGKYGKEWARVSILNDAGEAVPSVPDHRVSNDLDGAFGVYDEPSLDAGEVVQGTLVASENNTINASGEYSVRVEISIPYTVGQTPALYSSVVNLPLTVTPLDATQLGHTAAALRIQALGSDPERPSEAIAELFSMPEAHVLPTWQSLARDTTLNETWQSAVIGQLGRLGSSNCVSLLGELAWDPQQTELVRTQAGFALRNIHYTTQDPLIKQQVEELYIANEGAFPVDG
jgi:hypothetical protein